MHCLLLLLLIFTTKNIDAANRQTNFPSGLDLRADHSLDFRPEHQQEGLPSVFQLILDAQRINGQGTFRHFFSQTPVSQALTIFVKRDEKTGRNQVFTERVEGAVAYYHPLARQQRVLPPLKLKGGEVQEFVPKSKQVSSSTQDNITELAARIAAGNLSPEQRNALIIQMNQLVLQQSAPAGGPVVSDTPKALQTDTPTTFIFGGPADPALLGNVVTKSSAAAPVASVVHAQAAPARIVTPAPAAVDPNQVIPTTSAPIIHAQVAPVPAPVVPPAPAPAAHDQTRPKPQKQQTAEVTPIRPEELKKLIRAKKSDAELLNSNKGITEQDIQIAKKEIATEDAERARQRAQEEKARQDAAKALQEEKE